MGVLCALGGNAMPWQTGQPQPTPVVLNQPSCYHFRAFDRLFRSVRRLRLRNQGPH